jgi:hypothetical protein
LVFELQYLDIFMGREDPTEFDNLLIGVSLFVVFILVGWIVLLG